MDATIFRKDYPAILTKNKSTCSIKSMSKLSANKQKLLLKARYYGVVGQAYRQRVKKEVSKK
jgi:hypothetical protein